MCVFLCSSTNRLIVVLCIVSAQWPWTPPPLALPCEVSSYHDWEHVPVLVRHIGFDEWYGRHAELGSILIPSGLQVTFKKFPGQQKTAHISLLDCLRLQISRSQILRLLQTPCFTNFQRFPREAPDTRQDPWQGQDWKKLLQTACELLPV